MHKTMKLHVMNDTIEAKADAVLAGSTGIVVAALSHSSVQVRIEAALTLRALAEVDPTCVGGLISYGTTTLHALRESASIGELNSLHGQALALAALVSISPKLLLSYPARLPKSVLDVSKKMLIESIRNPVAATVEKEAGWLLSSLIASMPNEFPRLSQSHLLKTLDY